MSPATPDHDGRHLDGPDAAAAVADLAALHGKPATVLSPSEHALKVQLLKQLTNSIRWGAAATGDDSTIAAQHAATVTGMLTVLLDWLGGNETDTDTLRSLMHAGEQLVQGLVALSYMPSNSSPAEAQRLIAACSCRMLGYEGVRCIMHLSEHRALLARWLNVLADLAHAAVRVSVPVTQQVASGLWVCCKGVAGLGSSSADVRTAAVRLACITVHSAGQGHIDAPAAVQALAPSWQVCLQVLAMVAPRDEAAKVRAAAITHAAPLLAAALSAGPLAAPQPSTAEAGSARHSTEAMRKGVRDAAAALGGLLAGMLDPDPFVIAAAKEGMQQLPQQVLRPVCVKASQTGIFIWHPVADHLVTTFTRAAQHTDGPLAASKDCSTMVRAVAGLLLYASQQGQLPVDWSTSGFATSRSLIAAAIAMDTHAARVLLQQQQAASPSALTKPSVSVLEDDHEQEGATSDGAENMADEAARYHSDDCRQVQHAVQQLLSLLPHLAPGISGQSSSAAGAPEGLTSTQTATVKNTLVNTALLLEAAVNEIPKAIAGRASSKVGTSDFAPGLDATCRAIAQISAQLPSSSTAPVNAAAQLPADVRERLLAVAETLVAAVETPDARIFADLGGAPGEPQHAAPAAEALERRQAAAHCMHALASIVSCVLAGVRYPADAGAEGVAATAAQEAAAQEAAPTPSSSSGGPAGQSQEPSPRSGPSSPAGITWGLVIEELPDDGQWTPNSSRTISDAQQHAVLAARGAELVDRLVKTCAVLGADDQLFSPWALLPQSTPATPDPSVNLLSCLAATLRLARPKSKGGAFGSSSHAALAPQEASQQLLLAMAAERVVPVLRRVVAAGPTLANQDAQQGFFPPSSGPGTFERAVAARGITWIARRLQHPYLSSATPVLLAGFLAALQDPTSAVAVYGARGLQHLASEGLAADLKWQAGLLMDAVTRSLVGCEETLWPVAAPAAVAVICTLEGHNPRAPGLHALASTLLTEIERNAHKATHRLPFLAHNMLHKLLGALGLTVLRHMSRLLPLLLEWLQAHDRATRAAAADALHCLITHTWPRMPTYAQLLEEHLTALIQREEADQAGTKHSTSPAADGSPAAYARAACCALSSFQDLHGLC